MSSLSPAHIGSVERIPASHRRKRKPVNCYECRRSKLRCDRQFPCGACKRRGREVSCSYDTVPGTHISPEHHPTPTHAQPPVAQSNPTVSSGANVSTEQHPIPALAPSPAVGSNPTESLCTPTRSTISQTSVLQAERPAFRAGQQPPHAQWGLEDVLERPAPENEVQSTLSPLFIGPRISLQEIIDLLPPKSCCDFLVSQFFKIVSNFFPILHGPTFQRQYTDFMQRPHDVDLAWLALLFSMCSLALSTTDETDVRLVNLWPQLSPSPSQNKNRVPMSHFLLRTAMTCLLKDHFFVCHKFSTLEALLMVIYNLSHNESIDHGWGLLGLALNIGIALRCNVDCNLGPIDTERRRRCWAGLLTLHTYQGMIFRDVDMSYLLSINASLPADVNDCEITNEGIAQPSERCGPTQMSVMMAKIRLFRLSTEICRHISNPAQADQDSLHEFDLSIAEEQRKWDSLYMYHGSPKILDSTSFAHWCVLQTYAYHLYLLLHRPFHHSKAALFLPKSREICISSSAGLISIHRQLYEAPLLQNYSWLLKGLTSLKALHAAMILNSCLLDPVPTVEIEQNVKSLWGEIEKLSSRMEDLRRKSEICSKAHQVLHHLRAQLGTAVPVGSEMDNVFQNLFDDCTDIREWMDLDWINDLSFSY